MTDVLDNSKTCLLASKLNILLKLKNVKKVKTYTAMKNVQMLNKSSFYSSCFTSESGCPELHHSNDVAQDEENCINSFWKVEECSLPSVEEQHCFEDMIL